VTHTIAFVGDIHGHAQALDDVLSKLGADVRTVVFLGDYVNRGPDSKGVLERLLALQSGPREIVLLSGNHDRQLERVLVDDAALNDFLRMGGAATIRSYVGPPYRNVLSQLRGAVPTSHRQLLASMVDTWETEEVVATHNAEEAPRGDNRFVVAGHDLQTGLLPVIRDHTALIDTGCGTMSGGRLTALLWPSLEWVQSDQV